MIYILYYLAKRNEMTPLETTNIRATPRHVTPRQTDMPATLPARRLREEFPPLFAT